MLNLAVLALSLAAFAGDRFVLTDTRYGPAHGSPQLVASDRDVVLFWNDGNRFRATRAGSAEAGPSRSVLPNTGADSASVVWTGSHFLMVAWQRQFTSRQDDDDIVGRLVDASGEPVGEPFLIVDGGVTPQIAFDGSAVLLLYLPARSDQIHALRLSPDGVPLDAEPKATGVHGGLQGLASNGRSFAAVVSDNWERKVVLFDRSGTMTSLTGLVTDYAGVGTIASDGERYLVADGAGGRLYTLFIEGDGTAGAPLDLVPQRGGDIHPTSLAWSGSQWLVAYAEDRNFRVAYLDGATRAVERQEEGAGLVASIAARAGKPTFAWLPEVPGTIHVAQSAAEAIAAAPASQAATRQQLRAAASSPHGTLVLWEEDGLRAGVRRNDGSWIERELPIHPAFDAVAASDGEGFAALAVSTYGTQLVRLDRDGGLLGEPIALDWQPEQILWTGRDYLLYRPYDNDVEVATLSRTGVLSPRRIVDLGLGGMEGGVALASNGDGFYAVWLIAPQFTTPPLPPVGAGGMRLAADLTPLEAPVTFAPFVANEYTYDADVAWDGTQYAVAWSGDYGVRVSRVSAQTGVASEPQVVFSDSAYGARVQAVGGGVLVDWLSDVTPYLAFVTASATTATVLPRAGTVTALANGNAALIESSIADDAPVDGALRVHMTVFSRGALPQRPEAPQLLAPAHGDAIELRWTAPPQTIDGYRVEMRREDGPWIEAEHPLPPTRQSMTIATNGRKLFLRMRAWNEAGPGEYSQPVVVNAGKRRVVRMR